MENASQALIIAGTILLAMMVLGVGVYLVSNYSQVGESYEQTRITAEITKFNTNFTKFIGRTDITAQEIITLNNFAQNYDKNNGTSTSVKVGGGPITTTDDAEFIKKYEPKNELKPDGSATVKMQYFKCEEDNITYNEGRVTGINFTKI